MGQHHLSRLPKIAATERVLSEINFNCSLVGSDEYSNSSVRRVNRGHNRELCPENGNSRAPGDATTYEITQSGPSCDITCPVLVVPYASNADEACHTVTENSCLPTIVSLHNR